MSDGALLALLIFMCGAIAGALISYLFVFAQGTASGGVLSPPRKCPSSRMIVSQLIIYPIKSCAGIAVNSAPITRRGLLHDREFMIVDDTGRFLSQRKAPKMALLKPAVMEENGYLEIYAGDGPDPFVLDPLSVAATEIVQVTVWKSVCSAVDQGDDVAAFLSGFLQIPGIRLVRMAEDCVRQVEEGYVTPHVYETSFSDGYPYLLSTESSRHGLSLQAGRDISMKRFRPNIVVDGEDIEPFDEDYWETAMIGNAVFSLPKICSRCKIPTVDPETGVFDKDNEPTATLKRVRSQGQKVLFGQNGVCIKGVGEQVLSVGDEVHILSMHAEKKI